MKRVSFLRALSSFLLVFLLYSSSGLYAFGFAALLAQPGPSNGVQSTEPEYRDPFHTRLQLGGDYTFLQLQPQGKPTLSGNLGGAQFLFDAWSSGHFYGGVNGAWRQGTVDRNHKNRSILYADGQARLGWVLGQKKSGTSWSFFTGFGYHYLTQHFRQRGISKHYRYNECYVPVGILMEFAVSPRFALELNFAWMPQVSSIVKIKPSKRSHYVLKREITNFSLELPFDFTLTKSQRLHLIVSPFGQYWKDGSGTGHTKIRRNTYNYWGVDVNFGFCF